MAKLTRVYVLRDARDEGVAKRIMDALRAQDGVRAEVFDLAKVKGLPDPAAAWYIVLLSPELAGHPQKLDWVMDHHPDRVVPVLVRDCVPEVVHPRLGFLVPYDLRQPTDAALAHLRREWASGGSRRAKTPASLLMLLSLKGGVAKTTTTVAVAEYLAEQGNRVLVIDTDHQCGASAMLLGEKELDDLENANKTLSDLLTEALDDDFQADRIARFAVQSQSILSLGARLHVIAGSLRLEDFSSNFRPAKNREAKTALDAVKFLREKRRDVFARWLKANYDFVFIDCPPAIAWQVRFFLLVADGYIVPTIPDRLSVRGARHLTRRLHNIGVKTTRPVGLLWSMRREIETHSEYANTIRTGREKLGFERPDAPDLPRPFRTVIPHAVAITRAQVGNDPYKSFAAKYERDSTGRFKELCREILERARQSPQNAPTVQPVVVPSPGELNRV
jgi:chromosome partitioning protein